MPTPALPLVWAAFHVLKSGANSVFGKASDCLGRRVMLAVGYGIYAASYLLFSVSDSLAVFLAVFAAYGVHYGFVEGVEKAAIADLCTPAVRGRGLGLYQGALGLVLLPASAGFGAIRTAYGPDVAFRVCGVIALAGPIVLPFVRFGLAPKAA